MNSQELKPCPFCGEPAEENSPPDVARCSNDECQSARVWFLQTEWERRPIEDELRARIERLEAACRWLAKHCSTFDFIINEFDPMHKTYSIQQYLEWAEAAEEETHAPR